jgi:GTP-binding protein
VLTKADTVKGPALQRIVEQTTAALRHFPAAHPEVMVTSASEGIGVAEMRAELARLAVPQSGHRVRR